MIKVTLFPTTLSMNKAEVTFFIKVYIVFALIVFTCLPENQIQKKKLLIQTNSFMIFTSPNPVSLVHIFPQHDNNTHSYIQSTKSYTHSYIIQLLVALLYIRLKSKINKHRSISQFIMLNYKIFIEEFVQVIKKLSMDLQTQSIDIPIV